MSASEFVQGESAPKSLLPRGEQDIMRTWGSAAKPLVSIVCATYNHVAYLEDALCGFLAQVTTFPFEIIVRDDASTDGTTELLLGYADRYPKIFRTVIEKENQYSKGIRATPTLVSHARGEFIAICEGDDYWIMPDKLEKQVALLRAYPQATMSVARTVVCKQEEVALRCEMLYCGNDKDLQTFEDIKTCYFHTSTYLVRTQVYREVLAKYLGRIEFGDTALRYMLADIGPFAQLKEIVSVYRLTGSGIWTSLDRRSQVVGEIRLAEGFYRHFNPAHRLYFGMRLLHSYRWMILEGQWSFNRRSALENLSRYGCLRLRFGIRNVLALLRRIASKT